MEKGWRSNTKESGKAIPFLLGALLFFAASPLSAATLDPFGQPPPGDPSAFTGPFIGLQFAKDLLATLPPAMEGSFEGSSHTAVGANNAIPPALQVGANVPTNSKPS